MWKKKQNGWKDDSDNLVFYRKPINWEWLKNICVSFDFQGSGRNKKSKVLSTGNGIKKEFILKKRFSGWFIGFNMRKLSDISKTGYLFL